METPSIKFMNAKLRWIEKGKVEMSHAMDWRRRVAIASSQFKLSAIIYWPFVTMPIKNGWEKNGEKIKLKRKNDAKKTPSPVYTRKRDERKTTYDMAIVLQRCLRFDADMMSYSQLKIFQCNQEYQQVHSNRHIRRALFFLIGPVIRYVSAAYWDASQWKMHVHLITFHSDSKNHTRVFSI